MVNCVTITIAIVCHTLPYYSITVGSNGQGTNLLSCGFGAGIVIEETGGTGNPIKFVFLTPSFFPLGLVYQNILAFGGCWGQYVAALNDWKSIDIDRLVEELHRYWAQLQVRGTGRSTGTLRFGRAPRRTASRSLRRRSSLLFLFNVPEAKTPPSFLFFSRLHEGCVQQLPTHNTKHCDVRIALSSCFSGPWHPEIHVPS